MNRPKPYHLPHLVMALSLLLLLVGAPSQADPYVWPAWRAVTANGKEFQSRQLGGKVVVVAMWASWCPSSRKQLPVMDKLQQFYRSEPVQVLSFSFDHSERVHQEFVRNNDLRLPSIYARSGEGLKVVKTLQEAAGTLEAVPTVLIYDKRGRLVHRLVGFFNRKQLEDLIAPLLQE